jgi:hypothetical protein
VTENAHPRLHALRATSSGGWSILIGPTGIGEGIILIDRYLAPNGWTPRFHPLTPVDQAIRHFTAARNPQPVAEADFFVALRRAIVCHETNDGADTYRTRGLLAHIEQHRPYRLFTGDEECMLGECDHDSEDGRCPSVEEVEPICAGCSLIVDTGSEFGPDIVDEAQVGWPCTPLEQLAKHYGVPLDLPGVHG